MPIRAKSLWTRNVATDTGRKVPEWGFASSPLIVNDVVIVAAASTLAAYDLTTGAPRWQGPSYGGGYSSPQRVTIDGVVQVVPLCWARSACRLLTVRCFGSISGRRGDYTTGPAG
ncbi:MAG: hypothetical protein U0Y68_05390 [Blastocatellia bacterium]